MAECPEYPPSHKTASENPASEYMASDNPSDCPDSEFTASECTASEYTALSILHLPHADVLYDQVFQRLPLSSLFQLRASCTAFRSCVGDYFRSMRVLDLTQVPPKFGLKAFEIVTRDAENLRVLNVRNSKDWLTDSVLTPVIGQNPFLERVDFTSCTCLRHLSVAKLTCCEDLRELSFRECQWLASDSFMQLVWARGNMLEKLDLSGCWDINDQAVIAIASCCRNLRSLSLSKIYGITDHSMMEIAKNCTRLRHLNITNCWRVTDETIKLLGEYCKELHMLQIQQCREVTELSLGRLRARGVKMDIPQQKFRSADVKHLDFLRSLKTSSKVEKLDSLFDQREEVTKKLLNSTPIG